MIDAVKTHSTFVKQRFAGDCFHVDLQSRKIKKLVIPSKIKNQKFLLLEL
jgi:hypothetical protein